MGRVYIAMYHHIRAGRGDMFRTVNQFRADLEQYYKLGFRPVLASAYVENKMSLPSGASPIVLTFDDSNPSQLQLAKDGTVDPNCAVGIWMAFAKEHPDFPVHGTFFVLPDSMWGRDDQVSKKLKILTSLGSEIGNHTINHPFLNRLSDERVKWELGRATARIAALGVHPPHVMAVPYGVMPRHESLLKGFNWKGKHVAFIGVFRADGPPARSPDDPKFTNLRIPRMVATSGSDSVQSFLRLMAEGKYAPYVQP
jgi:peptidoglycan/xylan/chitin deacetylase (PgdA/CDA1 family)